MRETPTRYLCPQYPDGFDESLPLDFHSPYGCSKGTADQYLLDYHRIFGLRTVVFRHSSMFGGRQFATYDQGWIGWFCGQALAVQRGLLTKPFTISGSGKQVRDVLFVDDILTLYQAAVTRIHQAEGQAFFNIGGGVREQPVAVGTVLQLERELGLVLQYDHLPWRPGDQKIFIADNRKATDRLGWEPAVSAEDGIRRMLSGSRISEGVRPLTRIEFARIDAPLRSYIVFRSAVMTALIRGAAVALGFFIVPLIIAYLGVEKYGIWVTVLSVLYWLTFFDFGIGNGLRNRLSEAVSREDAKTGRELVSTAYAAIGIFTAIALVAGLCLIAGLDWTAILHAQIIPATELSALITIVLVFALAGFWLSLCHSVGYAFQQAFWAAATTLIGQCVFAGGLLLLGVIGGGSVLLVGLIYGFGNLLGYLAVTAILFRRYPEVRPSPRHIVPENPGRSAAWVSSFSVFKWLPW